MSASKVSTPSLPGRFVTIAGVRLHYLEEGAGRPLVLLHGNGALAEDFAISGLLAHASRLHRVIAFDRPGAGYSDRPRLRLWTPRAQAALFAKAIAGLGLSRPVVLGHSWGTLPALALALDHPGSVAGLVLLSGYYYPTPRADIAFFSPPAIPIVGDVLRYAIGPAIGRMIAPRLIRRIFEPSAPPERFLRDFPLDLALRPSQIRAVAEDTAFLIPATAFLRRRYASLRLPVSILTGDQDRVVDFRRHSAALHQEIAGSRLGILPGLGHMIHYFAHDAIMDAVAWIG